MHQIRRMIEASGLIGLLVFLFLGSGMASAKHVHRSRAKRNTVTIYLARHGQTTGNVMTLDEGWDDYPLTPKGDQVAKDVGAGLRGIHFTDAACGKLIRHLDTIKDMLDYSNNSNVTVL
ncbi:hypothetical protein WR164_15530 [Philodulcilactobacillus myokoensis]|uniref:Histidine phosphatase family protein n=1 Tax=Philodulcilactobacillus myokoensis TaxID=2929573 RepID=A0A9W6EUT8_9LACO|nr:histidine phosphatase family protein [Philodulcilactobacillus myokoensis]GLB47574.1 hypothetical protein WR164_15530 [Philodulcilactobacillus myokoensis]